MYFKVFFDKLDLFLQLSDTAKKAMERLGIRNLRDLIFYKPTSYNIININPDLKTIKTAQLIQTEVVLDQILRPLSGSSPLKIRVSNHTGSIILTFFHKIHPYIFSKLYIGKKYVIFGHAEPFDNILRMNHPEFIFTPRWQTNVLPVYPLTYGIVGKQLYSYIREGIDRLENIVNIKKSFAEEFRKEQQYLNELLTYIKTLHMIDAAPPYDGLNARLESNRAKLAALELFANQVSLSVLKLQEHKNRGRSFKPELVLQQKILDNLGFELTKDQKIALEEIGKDQAGQYQMMRLLQGDVGSGKTLVALLSMIAVVKSGAQAALMAPTDLLSIQHYQFFCKSLEGTGIRPALLTGKTCQKDRKRIKEDLLAGNIDILIGTHALFQESVNFKGLGYIVIDEQHRFGVEQRLELINKASCPDVLVMTATPIPRSLTLTMFGDMEISLIRDKPKNRLPVVTSVISGKKRQEVINSLASRLDVGEKIYWVCPLIDKSDKELKNLVAEGASNTDMTRSDMVFADVATRFTEISSIYPGRVGMLHGKIKGPEKDQILQDFRDGHIDILVSTTVIEVGIDVPNASLIVVENAEKFGLASLHQLRGRVGRGSLQSYCLLIYNPKRLSAMAGQRLKIMRKSNDGFYIAEQDLVLRGGGEILGTRQSGQPEFFFADLARDLRILIRANNAAKNVKEYDDEFINFQIELFAKNKRELIKSG